MGEPLIGILMATYNGEQFINEQIDSILAQTYKNWVLIIHDDGSEDATVEKIKDYVKKYPEKIILIEDKIIFKNAKDNFSYLMKIAQSEFDFNYIMFSDQDDVWFKNKIEKTLKKMKKLENIFGERTPILIHTDLKVVDKNLKILSHSFWKYQNLKPKLCKFNYLLVQNNITGNTVMINKSLLKLATPVGKRAIMHDWWTGLVASAFGKISFLKEPLIFYRQHGRNDTGAKKWNMWYLLDKNKCIPALKKVFLQAEDFKHQYESFLSPENLEILNAFLSLSKVDYLNRVKNIFKYKLFKNGIIRTMAYLWHIKYV